MTRLLIVRRHFPDRRIADVPGETRRQLDASGFADRLRPGARVAIGVGSRGVANIAAIVRSVVQYWRDRGMAPFVFPAMGSHGAATPEGQTDVLAHFGITEASIGCPIVSRLDVVSLGHTADGIEVFMDAAAHASDAVMIVARVKWHTTFSGRIESGLLKMMVIGLGKRRGAATYHAAANEFGHEHVIRTAGRIVLQKAPILCGVGIIENQSHLTEKIELIKPADLEAREEQLLEEARGLLARLPFREIDLLIVDRIGKNISGAGMDPNVIGRAVQGYSALFPRNDELTPNIRRIFVRELTNETHGNAIGIGLADFTTSRAVKAINKETSYINALTALTPQTVKIPIHFETDKEAISNALNSLALRDTSGARIVRISDTLSLELMEVSESFVSEVKDDKRLVPLGEVDDMSFDDCGNLLPISNHI